MSKYEALRPYCNTDSQRLALDALDNYPTVASAAKSLNVSERNLYERIRTLKKRAAKRGLSAEHDMTKTTPEGFTVKGTSTLYDENGEVKAQWVKTQQEKEQVEHDLRLLFDELKATIKPIKPTQPLKKKRLSDLLNVHILTDYHIGMNAWSEQTGEDWDMKIAEDLLFRWFEYTIKNAPDAETGLLAQLGDFLHWDGMLPITPVHNHVLDADTRFQKVIRVAIRSLRRVIAMMLKKYDKVHLIMAEGNHDPASSAWLREMFSAFYDEEPRLTIDTSPDPYYCHRHGLTSIFFHHGHKRRPESIDDVFAAKFREVFGQTRHSYAHMGHMHHLSAKETNLMVVEQHRTLAAKDAYASTGGWLAGRSAPVITYHKEYGDVGRLTVTPDMV